MKETKAYGALSAELPLQELTINRRELLPIDVEIKVTYCGVCHADLHNTRNDWGNAKYPMVPGHEMVGVVTKLGYEVTQFKIGDLVAVGCVVDSCKHCKNCDNNLQQYCLNGYTGKYNGEDLILGGRTYGGYSETIIVHQDYVLSVPSSLNLPAVAPLLCAGITTWSPLRHWNVGKGSKVAVVGLGGLGHMAIKLAKALGAEVSLFSRTPGKSKDAYELGAGEVIISTDISQMEASKEKFDLIIDTVPYIHDINPYVETLNTNGTLVIVGYLGGLTPLLETVPMIMGRKSVAGSVVGGIKETQEMLDFCGEHNITAEIELVKMNEINEVFKRLKAGDVKYRFVIDVESFYSKKN